MRCRLVPEVSPISSSHPHPGADADHGAARRPRTGTGVVLFPRNPRAQKEARGHRPPTRLATSTTRSVAPMPRRTSGRRACRTPQARPRPPCRHGSGASPSSVLPSCSPSTCWRTTAVHRSARGDVPRRQAHAGRQIALQRCREAISYRAACSRRYSLSKEGHGSAGSLVTALTVGVTVDHHGKLPDVVVYMADRDWLVLPLCDRVPIATLCSVEAIR